MLIRMTLAAAAIALTTPALADDICTHRDAATSCAQFERAYSDNTGVPTSTIDVWPNRRFVVDNFWAPGIEDRGIDAFRDGFGSDDVYYYDGRNGHVVSDVTGPQVDILHW